MTDTMTKSTRRSFLGVSLASLAPWPVVPGPEVRSSYSFIVLGDLHFDQLKHHDRAWLDANHPRDWSQILNYSHLTTTVMPLVFSAVRQHIEQLSHTDAPVAFVLQVGDLVEGLCGSEELAIQQNQEALAFIASAQLGVPFLFTKGNHDITGDGADAAFHEVLQPFMHSQATQLDDGAQQTGANVTLTHADTQLVFFDAYHRTSLDWLEATLVQRRASRLVVTIHPPVVPYGARSSWHVYAGEKAQSRRDKLLSLLGAHDAVVISGHLHKYATLRRRTAGGQFSQLAISSIVSDAEQQPKDVRQGSHAYSGSQVDLEPMFSPETREMRRDIYTSEAGHVTDFEYANAAGFAIVQVTGDGIQARVHSGTHDRPFQTVSL